MGDFNAAINDSARPFNKQASKIIEWEKSGEIRILNDKQAPTHVPFAKGQEKNCLDFIMITPGLEKRTKNYKLDENREWTPAKSVPTREGSGPEKNTQGEIQVITKLKK